MVFLWLPHPFVKFVASWWDFQPRVPQPTAAWNLPSDLEAACWSDLALGGSPTLGKLPLLSHTKRDRNIADWDYYCCYYYYYHYYHILSYIIIYYHILSYIIIIIIYHHYYVLFLWLLYIYCYLLTNHHNVLEQAWNKFDLGWLHPDCSHPAWEAIEERGHLDQTDHENHTVCWKNRWSVWNICTHTHIYILYTYGSKHCLRRYKKASKW